MWLTLIHEQLFSRHGSPVDPKHVMQLRRTPRKGAKASVATAEAGPSGAETTEQDVAAVEAAQSPCADVAWHKPPVQLCRGMPYHSNTAGFSQCMKHPSSLSNRKPRKRKRAADSPAAEAAGEKLARTPSKRIGVLSDDEIQARLAF